MKEIMYRVKLSETFLGIAVIIILFLFSCDPSGTGSKNVILDFDDPVLFPTHGMAIYDQYADYTLFTSNNGSVTMYNANSDYVHEDIALWAGDNLIVTFSKTVTNLNFYIIAMNTSEGNQAADIEIYQGSSLIDTYILLGEGTPTVPYLLDLSSYGEIDKIHIENYDSAGMVYDTFSFTVDL